jgi:hypothetical protein
MLVLPSKLSVKGSVVVPDSEGERQVRPLRKLMMPAGVPGEPPVLALWGENDLDYVQEQAPALVEHAGVVGLRVTAHRCTARHRTSRHNTTLRPNSCCATHHYSLRRLASQRNVPIRFYPPLRSTAQHYSSRRAAALRPTSQRKDF